MTTRKSRLLSTGESGRETPPKKASQERGRGREEKLLVTTLRISPKTMARLKLFLEEWHGSRMGTAAQIAREALMLMETLALRQRPSLEMEVGTATEAWRLLRKSINLDGSNREAFLSALQDGMEADQSIRRQAEQFAKKLEKGGDETCS